MGKGAWDAIRKLAMTMLFLCCVSLILDQPAVPDEPSKESAIDCTFVADHDGSQQKYVLILPKDFALDQPSDALIALHGHGSDRWQFVRDSRDECRAARDFAASTIQMSSVCIALKGTTARTTRIRERPSTLSFHASPDKQPASGYDILKIE